MVKIKYILVENSVHTVGAMKSVVDELSATHEVPLTHKSEVLLVRSRLAQIESFTKYVPVCMVSELAQTDFEGERDGARPGTVVAGHVAL